MDYKYHRCKTCGIIVTDPMIEEGFCIGHKVSPCVRGNMWEWVFIKLNIYEWFMLKFADGRDEKYVRERSQKDS